MAMRLNAVHNSLNADCLRSWRREQPQATHHPEEQCCHTAVWSRTPPTMNNKPRELPDKPNINCGAVPRIIRTYMDRINCTCLQENMFKTADRLHEFMYGNKTDILLGTIWELPPRMGLSNVYPSPLPVVSKCILGKESFYSAGGMEILQFYTPDCMIGLFVSLLVCGLITATAKTLMRAQSRRPLSVRAVRYFFNLFDACLLYFTEHLQMTANQFPSQTSVLMTDKWLHLCWLLGSFLLYTIASNDLINLLISPLESTRYKSLDDVVARNQSDLMVYYFPQSSLDLLVRMKQINLRNPFRVPTGRYFLDQKQKVFYDEMINEKSIVVAAWDNLEHLQTEYISYNTYKQLDAEEDSYSYIFTSTTMAPIAEQYFREVYMHGFLESGCLKQDVALYRWSLMLGHNMKLASEMEGDETASHGQHFEPLKLDGLVEFLIFCAACHVIVCLLFAPIYALRHYDKMKLQKQDKTHDWYMSARQARADRSQTVPIIRNSFALQRI